MRVVQLSEVASLDRRNVDPTQLDPDTPYLGLEHIENGGRILGHSSIGSNEVKSTKFLFDEDHLLYGKLRPNLAKIAIPNISGVCSTDILPIKTGPDLDRGYLAHYLRQPSMVAFSASRTSGINLPRLSPVVLAKFPVPLPSLKEQRRIVAILDQADSLRTKRRQVLADLGALTQSIFHDMFGSLQDRNWHRVPLHLVVTVIENGTSRKCETRRASDREWGILKLGAVTSGTFRAQENKAYLSDVSGMTVNEVKFGDVLMTRKNTRELVGAVAVVDDVRPRLLLPDLIFRLKLDSTQINSQYFQALMMNPMKRQEVQALAGGSAGSMPNISKARLSKLPLELPPIPLQEQFAARVRCAAAHRERVKWNVFALDRVFESLQQRAFRGQS